jgi:hypothetical protein
MDSATSSLPVPVSPAHQQTELGGCYALEYCEELLHLLRVAEQVAKPVSIQLLAPPSRTAESAARTRTGERGSAAKFSDHNRGRVGDSYAMAALVRNRGRVRLHRRANHEASVNR